MGKPVKGEDAFKAGETTKFAWVKTSASGLMSMGGRDDEDGVKHAVILMHTYDTRHMIEMGSSGARDKRTTIEAPRGISVKCGADMCRETAQDPPPNASNGTFLIQVEHGDLTIDVQDGDLNINARSINLSAEGETEEIDGVEYPSGLFTLKCNEMVDIDAPKIDLTGGDTVRITSNNLLRIFSDVHLEMITGIGNLISWSSRTGKKPDIYEEDYVGPGDPERPFEANPDKATKKPTGWKRVAGGMIDALTGGLTDLDERSYSDRELGL